LWEKIKKYFSNTPIWKEFYYDKKMYNLKIYPALEKVKKIVKLKQQISFKKPKTPEKPENKDYVIKNISLPK
jgi:hypothetical protein